MRALDDAWALKAFANRMQALVLEELGPLLELKEDPQAEVTLRGLFTRHLP